MKTVSHTLHFLILGFLLLFSCKKAEENPQPNEENELITTVRLHLTPPSGPMVMATWKDLSPDDETGRTIDTLYLSDSTLYAGTIELLDETKTPASVISDEVKTEGKDHLFVYKPVAPLTASNLVIARIDHDVNHLELGLQYSLETKTSGTGGLRVILRHQPGEKNGSEAPGDSDVDVVFPVKIL